MLDIIHLVVTLYSLTRRPMRQPAHKWSYSWRGVAAQRTQQCSCWACFGPWASTPRVPIKIGMKVFVKKELAVVKFIGRTEFYKGVWLGVVFRTPGENKRSCTNFSPFNSFPVRQVNSCCLLVVWFAAQASV